MNNNIAPIIQLENISKSFVKADKQELLVLENINFTLQEGEIVALLGKSGSGKSTLLRIIAGLISPSRGIAKNYGQPITEPVAGISMVFQSFALLPWLTVLENVEIGLEAIGIERKERRRRSLQAIDIIGLDGFESAYPKELSGGMRQRVGFARALVVQPEILLMDEPFSALDILTSEVLRGDLLDLWFSQQSKIKSILCVTHDIEEAILMADRVVIFNTNPGSIQQEITIDLPHPRDNESYEFQQLLNQIYSSMTTSERARLEEAKVHAKTSMQEETIEFAYRVPEVDIAELTGLLEACLEQLKDQEVISLPEIAEELHLDVNNLFPMTEVLDLLRFITINDGKLKLTQSGILFANANMQERKQIFAKAILQYIPLAKHIRETLDTQPGNTAHEDLFLDELGSYFSEDESDRILRTIIDWGRYAEIFAYDYDSGELSLENPQ